MSSSSPRKRVTVIASFEGIEKAERSLIRLGFESKSDFAKSQLLARNAVTKFFNRNPIQLDTFKRICDGLRVDWREILEPDSTMNILKPDRSGSPETVPTNARQLTVIDEQNKIQAIVVLQGDINSIDTRYKQTLEVLLTSYAGCKIQVTDIRSGSIRITIKGSRQGIRRLIEQFATKELVTIDGFPVEDIHLLSEKLTEEPKETNSYNKWNIVRNILWNPERNHRLQNLDLSDVDLSGADLSSADLRGANFNAADLNGANLRNANLNGADLSHTHLFSADLSSADLSNANLRNANLNRTNLRNADLSGADLSGADLRGAIINEETQLGTKWRLVWRIVNGSASDANFSSADLSGANLRSANLRSANLQGTDLFNADLSSADLSSADLSSADLRGVTINKETQLDTKWRLVWRIVNGSASDANFSGADLSSVGLRGANLTNADLSGTDLSGANLTNADLSRANLSRANLTNADLSGANLTNTDLSGADVRNTRFGEGLGLSNEDQRSLVERGAIFNDALGDREFSPSPIHR